METDPRYSPHQVLAPHYLTPEAKQAFLRRAFDESAVHYERIADWGFFGTGGRYRRQALARAGLAPGMRVVDVASGTGPTARAAAAVVGDPRLITCIEPSPGMLRESEKRLAARHLEGTAEAIPLPDDCCEFVSMGFALRHVDNLESAFREFRRILVPGGRLLIMDITKPASRIGNLGVRLYFRDVLPLLTGLMTGSRAAVTLMRYYWRTLDGMVPPERVLEALDHAGFATVRRHVEARIFSEYTAVRPPAGE